MGIVFWICQYWEIRKVVNGHTFILICKMAAQVRRTLAEVCTVPVLLVVKLMLIHCNLVITLLIRALFRL